MQMILHRYLISLKADQKKIFEKALEQIQMFENSKTYVREQEIMDNVAQMEAIVTAKNHLARSRNCRICL